MQVASELMSLRRRWRCLLVLGAISVLIGAGAHAQNIDQGKPAAKLFADSCATCHRSARGLAKGRFRLTLYLFLQQHYASNSSSAWALTSYLESVDSPQRGRSRAAAAKPPRPAVSTSRSYPPSARVGAGALGRRGARPKHRRSVRPRSKASADLSRNVIHISDYVLNAF